ncbi:metallophosphoesterase family protein [Halomicroarcula sp. GCM10025709]|uniref:metallophosphoesterase family protein n=1 Tax=Haloarcula TaxID=2237 RepID=UPI0024C3B7AD|nr:metallophosphoesterase family protein [Halomicroarcula sp. YJ-61-S]
MNVAIVSDTHIPSRASEIPAPFRERIEAADHVVHAGDFDSEGALSNVRAMAARLTAVAGNTDPRIGLPAVATVELGGVTFVVTHGTGSRRGYEDRVAEIVRREVGADAVGIAGHTHELLDTVHGGVRLLNPGSATGASPADRATMLTADVSDGELSLTVHEH